MLEKSTTLPQSCMGFITKSGETLFLHKEDIETIVMRIIVEGSLKKGFLIVKEKDTSIERANLLYDILKKEQDMKPELRHKYLKQIGELLSGQNIKLINCTKDAEEMELTVDNENADAKPIHEIKS